MANEHRMTTRSNFQNLIGRTFGSLKVKRYAGKSKHGQAKWECECICGTIKVFEGPCLKRSKMCGHQCPEKSDRDLYRSIRIMPNGCLEWTGSKDRYGYGQFKRRGKLHRVHRLMYATHVGPTNGLCVLHNCPGGDNPSCINPAHLFIGTNKDNTEDMIAKGRQATGERARPKLTMEQAKEIRRINDAGEMTQTEQAINLGVSIVTISAIVCRRTFKE